MRKCGSLDHFKTSVCLKAISDLYSFKQMNTWDAVMDSVLGFSPSQILATMPFLNKAVQRKGVEGHHRVS